MALTITEKITTLLKLISEPKIFSTLISFRGFGYLLEKGWFNSFKSGEPIDAELKPIPWFTYSAIDFLKDRLNLNLNIMEFGSGNSTLFFAERVKKVYSLEHDKIWIQKIYSKLPQNVELNSTSSASAEDYLHPVVEREKYDIIIVDGLFRNECIKAGLNCISDVGIIILDDSERIEYSEGIKFIVQKGFKQINFTGIAPGIFFNKCTSIFYKSNNCLKI